jgi:cell division protein FtsB
MNPLVIALGILISAGVATWLQAGRVRDLRAATRVIAQANTEAERSLESARAEIQAAEQRIQSLHADLRSVRTRIDPSRPGMPVPEEPVFPTEPESSWPSDRPFFHLPKRFLSHIRYDAIGPNDSVTRVTAALFSLSPAEEAAVNDVLRDFRFRLEMLQLDNARPWPSASPTESENQRERRFLLPGLPEEIRELKQGVEDRLRSVLGDQRGTHLAPHLDRELSWSINPLGGADVVVAYGARRDPNGEVRHWIRFTDPVQAGNMYELPVRFDPAPNQALTSDHTFIAGIHHPLQPDSALWNYRHLFGDQPLIPPTPAAGSADLPSR